MLGWDFSRLEVAAVADNSGLLIKLGMVGAVAYYAYTKGWLSSFGIGAPAAPAVVPVAPNPNAITGANSLDAIYQRMVAAAPAGSHGVDDWDYYLNAQLAPLGKVAPDPLPIFQAAVANFDRSQSLTAGQYWAVMAPALKTQLGVSGLGVWGGLACHGRVM